MTKWQRKVVTNKCTFVQNTSASLITSHNFRPMSTVGPQSWAWLHKQSKLVLYMHAPLENAYIIQFLYVRLNCIIRFPGFSSEVRSSFLSMSACPPTDRTDRLVANFQRKVNNSPQMKRPQKGVITIKEYGNIRIFQLVLTKK